MKKLLLIIFTFCYLVIQMSFSLCCLADFVKNEVAEQSYKSHVTNRPDRFNLLNELNKYLEHQKQQNNPLPDSTHQAVFSEYYQPLNNVDIIIDSIRFDFSLKPVSKITLGFSKFFSPPPEVIS